MNFYKIKSDTKNRKQNTNKLALKMEESNIK